MICLATLFLYDNGCDVHHIYIYIYIYIGVSHSYSKGLCGKTISYVVYIEQKSII
jgi:hypothetical protein